MNNAEAVSILTLGTCKEGYISVSKLKSGFETFKFPLLVGSVVQSFKPGIVLLRDVLEDSAIFTSEDSAAKIEAPVGMGNVIKLDIDVGEVLDIVWSENSDNVYIPDI